MRLWDVVTGADHRTLTGHDRAITSIAFSPCGLIVASASWDSTVHIWDTATGIQHQMLKIRGSVVRSLSFSHDGKCLRTYYGLFVSCTAIELVPLPQDIQSFRSALFIEEEWVIRDSKRFLLLPTHYQTYRPGSQTVTNSLIVLGRKSGRVTFIYFDLSS